MAKKIKTISPTFKIQEINLMDYRLSPTPITPPTAFEFDLEIQQLHQPKDALSWITTILVIKDDLNIICGNLTMCCSFRVENLSEILKDEEQVQKLNLMLNQITISTARGVLFGLFRGTFLHNAILPVLDEGHLKLLPASKI